MRRTHTARAGMLIGVMLAAGPALAQSGTRPAPDYGDAGSQNVLMFDPDALAGSGPSQAASAAAGPHNMEVKRTVNADGSASISMAKPLPTPWNVKVGADMVLPPEPRSTYEPGKPLPGTVNDPHAVAAWASVAVPDLATVDARVARTDAQQTVTATFRRLVPLSSRFSLTLENGYSMTEVAAAPTVAPENPAANPSQVWATENQVKLNVPQIGTTFSAGVSASTVDPVTHNRFSATQKIYGPLHVTTSVTDIDQPTSNKSVTGGFKFNW